jgi:hypothetical protein
MVKDFLSGRLFYLFKMNCSALHSKNQIDYLYNDFKKFFLRLVSAHYELQFLIINKIINKTKI